jgi:hypothetical protein
MKKQFIATFVAAILSVPVMAQNVIIENEFVRAGVNETSGTLGSGGNTRPGLQYDNTGTSTWPCDSCQGDYLTPGAPFEGFTVRLEDSTGTLISTYTNNNAGGATISGGAWVGTPTAAGATWGASNTDFSIQHNYSLPAGQKYIDITTGITANTAIGKLWFGRFIDPDAMPMTGDTSATDNVLGYGAIPRANVVFSEATVSRYALGLYTASSTGLAGISSAWSTNPRDYYANTSPYYEPLLDADGNKVLVDATSPWMGYQNKLDTDGNPIPALYGNGDHTVGLGFVVNNVAVGDIVTFKYAYIFGPSAFGAATSAVAGGAGGGTPGDVPGGGTLTDVGSATDSAAGGGTTTTPSTPTITSTSTATITVSDTTVVNTSLPVITASLAHHEASEGSGKQTVARGTTTNVTTPSTRSVVTLVRTTNTWSDGTTTTADSATTTANTLVNDVQTNVANESFSGRIDQMSYLTNLNKQLDRGLNMDAFRTDGYTDQEKKITMYVNASGARSNIDNGYNANSQIYGLGVEKEIKPNWRLGAQYNRVNTTMNGSDSKTAQDKDHIGVFSVYTADNDVKIVNNLGYADNTVKGNRTVENVFNNSHSTSGDNLWLNNRIYAPETKGFRPYAGVTIGRSTVGGYTEAGDIQSARTVAKTTDNYTYGEAGVRYEKAIDEFRLIGDISTNTDSVTKGAATVAYAPTKTGTIALTAATQHGNNINTNTVSLRGVIRF